MADHADVAARAHALDDGSGRLLVPGRAYRLRIHLPPVVARDYDAATPRTPSCGIEAVDLQLQLAYEGLAATRRRR